jgi:hypothetical protein
VAFSATLAAWLAGKFQAGTSALYRQFPLHLGHAVHYMEE